MARPPLHRPQARRGFTLIEMLAVIAVIALLAALVAGGAARARDSARRTHCLSNLRQLALVYHMYSDDHDRKLPSRDMLGNSSYRMATDPLGLPHHFRAYVPTNGIWMCLAGRSTLKPNGVNYAWSRAQNLIGEFGSKEAFDSAASTTIVWDNMTYALPSVFGVPEGTAGGPSAVTTALRYYPHNRRTKANYLLLDGRVETR